MWDKEDTRGMDGALAMAPSQLMAAWSGAERMSERGSVGPAVRWVRGLSLQPARGTWDCKDLIICSWWTYVKQREGMCWLLVNVPAPV